MPPVCRIVLPLACAGLIAGCGPEASPRTTGEAISPSPARAAEAAALPPPRPRAMPVERAESTDAVAAGSGEASGETVYRPDDDRPRHDDAALERAGIRRYDSRRLVLYSDVPAEKVAGLSALVDAVYEEWVEYFGALPPARDGSEFQITGYLIADADRFEAAGLLPEDLPPFAHGRHRGRRFWMRDQKHDYYRRHLLLHEATHCFMTLLPGSDGPVWYMEGMAELFGTHRIDDGGVQFRVMPTTPEEFAGLGRIMLARQEVAAGRFKTLDEVFSLRPEEYAETSAYAWSWAACHFFDSHPRCRERFRKMGDPRLRARFAKEFRDRFAADAAEIAVEWGLFAQTLRYGHDLERAAVAFRSGETPAADGPTEVAVAPDRGWQSSGVRVVAERWYAVAAQGRFTLADEPMPWVSDAGGISVDYFDGRPLGRLLAAVLADDGSAVDAAGGLLTPIDIGRQATVTAPATGTLYFRLNDGWDRLIDNRGSVQVTVRTIEPPKHPSNGARETE